MSKIYSFLAIIIIILVTIAGSFVGGIFWQKNMSEVKTTTVDSVVILDKIESEAYLLTKSVYINQESTIKVDQGSDWSNFWWGQTITAEGLMKVNVGLDFKKIKAEDILVDQISKVITIKAGPAEVISVSIDGNIKVKNEAGILKLIFDNDTNEDYNTALEKLTEESKAAVEANKDIMSDARNDSLKILKLILKDTGYDVKFQ
jgi:hypothetical protein